MNKSKYYVTYGYWFTHISSIEVEIEDTDETQGSIAKILACTIAQLMKYDEVAIINFWKM